MSVLLSVQMRDWDRLNQPSDAESYADRVAVLEAENERLRAALHKIADIPQHWKASREAANEAVMIARKAL